jgi:hypothetical protein
MSYEFDPVAREVFQREMIGTLKGAGLLLVPEEAGPFALRFYKEQQQLLKLKHSTPYLIAKYKLLPKHPDLRTIKNMVKDGRIRPGEVFENTKGMLQIMMSAVKRLRNE